MSATEIVFYGIAFVMIGGGLGVVLARNIVHSALALILALGAVAGIYVILTVEFLALTQLVVYGGAVIMLVLFALMLTRARERPQALFGKNRPIALTIAAGLLAAFVAGIVASEWATTNPDDIEPVPFQEIGDVLFSAWAVPFEVISVVLVIAMAGAILLSQPDQGEQ